MIRLLCSKMQMFRTGNARMPHAHLPVRPLLVRAQRWDASLANRAIRNYARFRKDRFVKWGTEQRFEVSAIYSREIRRFTPGHHGRPNVAIGSRKSADGHLSSRR